MKSATFRGILLALGPLALMIFGFADTAVAQMGPAARYVYGGWGGNSSYNTSRNIAAQQHAAAASRGFQQTRYVQNTIRSATMGGGASTMPSAEQAARDWMYRQQSRVAPAPRQSSNAPPPVSPGAMSPSPSYVASTLQMQTAPPKADDLIKWPALLRNSRFAEQRATVEAPYRRPSSEDGGPTVDDFHKMVDATAEMKLILKGMANEIRASQYLDAEKFLDTLAAEAREWAKRKAEAAAANEPGKGTSSDSQE